MKKLFLSLLVLLSLTCAVFAAEKDEKSSKTNTFVGKYYSFNVDGDTATMYFCEDGWMFLIADDDKSEVAVRRYVYNKTSNTGVLFDPNDLDGENLIFEYDAKKDLMYVLDGSKRYVGKPPRVVTPR